MSGLTKTAILTRNAMATVAMPAQWKQSARRFSSHMEGGGGRCAATSLRLVFRPIGWDGSREEVAVPHPGMYKKPKEEVIICLFEIVV